MIRVNKKYTLQWFINLQTLKRELFLKLFARGQSISIVDTFMNCHYVCDSLTVYVKQTHYNVEIGLVASRKHGVVQIYKKIVS